MRRSLYLIIYIVVWASVWTACTDDCADVTSGNEAYISLGASVVGLETVTRADGDNETTEEPPLPLYKGTPSAGNPFEADVCFSETEGEFLHTPTGITNLPCHTQITFEGALEYAMNPENGSNLKYTTGENSPSVYCVGFYPQNVWTVAEDGKTATAPIDGKTDLMFAPPIEGSWNNPLRTQTYNHLLTWLKVCVCSTSQEAADTWGKLKSISIQSADGLSVNLGTGAVTYTKSANASPFVVVENQLLHTTMQEVGKGVLCSPAKEYTLIIETTNARTRTITIPIKWIDEEDVTDEDVTSGKVAGRLFILSLYFNEYAVVEGVCTLNALNNQDEDLYLQEEQEETEE